MLLAVAAMPPVPDVMLQAARVSGLTLADVRQRLVGLLPRVLLNEPSGEGIEAVADAMRAMGFGVFLCDPRGVATDATRVVARTLAFRAGAFVVTDGRGIEHECRAADIELLQRGLRVSVDTRTVRSTTRQIDPVRAVVTGGLLVSKKVQQTTTARTESHEGFVLVQRHHAPEILLSERRLDFRCLGAEMQPSTAANLGVVLTRLRALAPAAPFDDRATRSAFLSGLPVTAVEPVDLGLHLVLLAHRAGVA